MRHTVNALLEQNQSLSSSNFSKDFSRIKTNNRVLLDTILDLSTISNYKNTNSKLGSKSHILKALNNQSKNELREISEFFYSTSGIYSRLCKYLSYLYKYDWYIIPYIKDMSKTINESKILKDLSKILLFFDNSYIRKTCSEIALKIIKDGCYYGYITDSPNGIFFQDLPVKYCRSRFKQDGFPVVEFNMKYFDENFSDTAYRMKILASFPKEFSKGYSLYKKKKLPPSYNGDTSGWYILDPLRGVKFSCGNNDLPMLVNAIPAIIDLDEAQGLDRKKMMQKLLKIIIQKLPLDKNNELVFDLSEAADMHSNAVQMLSNAIGVDVLTTFAEIDLIDLSDSRTTTAATDDLSKVERRVYNEFGVSRNLFNSDSNNALEKSILDDEASVRFLPQQFEFFFNRILSLFNSNFSKYSFKFKMLETTIYNYKDLSKMYKEQTQIGYSKMLPQIALGHSQSEILAMVNFENEILHLSDIMIPPKMSSTMSNSNTDNNNNNNANNNSNNKNNEDTKKGRPELEDDKKSDKTLANREAM